MKTILRDMKIVKEGVEELDERRKSPSLRDSVMLLTAANWKTELRACLVPQENLYKSCQTHWWISTTL